MKETYKEGLMLLAGLVMGLALGGLIVFIWLSDASTRTVQTRSDTTTNSATTDDTTTVTFDQFGFSAEIPATWQITKKVYETDQNGLNSEMAVQGPEGSVRFILNADGFGGGPCAGVEGEASFDLSKEVDVTTKAGVVTMCHLLGDNDIESWSSGSNFVRKDAHSLTSKDGKMFVILAQTKAPSAKNRSAVLKVIQSVAFK